MSALFGLDSVRRKFGDEPPAEWDAALLALSEIQIQHGLSDLLKSGRGHAPTLPEFLAVCRNAREWINPLRPDQSLSDHRFDEWDMAGNRHLLAFVLKMGGAHSYFDEAQTRILIDWKNAWARDCREFAVDGEVPVEQQQSMWTDCMQKAREAGAVGGRT